MERTERPGCGTDRDRLERTARELLATAVGFAVLGLNRVQVERRRFETACDRSRTTAHAPRPADRA